MELLEPCPIMSHHPDTMEVVRKTFGLEKSERIEESLKILEEWALKQAHFKQKEFSKIFLENMLMKAKGSVEKTKKRLEAMCTFRTIFPHMYCTGIRVNEVTALESVQDTILPKLTKEHHRVYMLRNCEKNYSDTFIKNYFMRTMTVLDYLLRYDYSAGLVVVVDYLETDLAKILAAFANTYTREGLLIIFKAYAMRLKGIHVISKSKLVEACVAAFKHILGPNIIDRFIVHKTIETLHDEVDRDILPADYGGEEAPLAEMSKNMLDVISTDEALKVLKEIEGATVDLNLKPVQQEYDEYLGISGSFRTLSVD